MILERLEIFGFKSFAKKAVLTFPLGITCIVGPNGCGKSNLADSIRWVLGEQSFKNLRIEKSDDLIFSSGKKRVNFSQVTLYLKDDKKGESLEITRKLFRNGENEYFINHQPVKKEEISFLLAKINFGQKSYSVIGQGMVDWILYSSKQERKEFFDEAAGIKEYQIKKIKAEAKIKRTLLNLSQAEIAIKEVEPRLKFLSRQIKRWEKRQKIEEEIINLKKDYYGAKLSKLEEEKKEIDRKIEKEKKILEKEEKDFEFFQKKIKKIAIDEPNQELELLKKDWQEILEKRNKLLEEKITYQSIAKKEEKITFEEGDLLKFKNSLEDILFQQEKFIKRLNEIKKLEEIVKIKEKANEIFQKIKNLSIFFSKITTREKRDEKELEKKEKELENINKELKVLEDKLKDFLIIENKKRKEMLEIQKELQEKQNIISSLNYKIKDLEIEKARIETKEEDLKNEIERETNFKDLSLLSKINLTDEEEEKIFSRIRRLEKELELIGSFDENLFQEYKETKEKYDFLSSQINDLKKSISSLQKIKRKLEEKIKDKFFSNFNKINENFKQYFKFLFKGGEAKLVLEELSSNEASENKERSDEINYGIEIYARPPRKKIKTIHSLSGGEKALTSLALLFAILKTQKPPFIVLDEVDAALDEVNSSRFVEIMKELSKDTQFIVITHNQITMESAVALYGITMDKEGVSHLVSFKLESH